MSMLTEASSRGGCYGRRQGQSNEQERTSNDIKIANAFRKALNQSRILAEKIYTESRKVPLSSKELEICTSRMLQKVELGTQNITTELPVDYRGIKQLNVVISFVKKESRLNHIQLRQFNAMVHLLSNALCAIEEISFNSAIELSGEVRSRLEDECQDEEMTSAFIDMRNQEIFGHIKSFLTKLYNKYEILQQTLI